MEYMGKGTFCMQKKRVVCSGERALCVGVKSTPTPLVTLNEGLERRRWREIWKSILDFEQEYLEWMAVS